MAVPKSTPADVQKQLSDLLDKINRDPGFIKKMEEGGFALLNIGQAEMPAFMDKMKARYGELAKEMGIASKK